MVYIESIEAPETTGSVSGTFSLTPQSSVNLAIPGKSNSQHSIVPLPRCRGHRLISSRFRSQSLKPKKFIPVNQVGVRCRPTHHFNLHLQVKRSTGCFCSKEKKTAAATTNVPDHRKDHRNCRKQIQKRWGTAARVNLTRCVVFLTQFGTPPERSPYVRALKRLTRLTYRIRSGLAATNSRLSFLPILTCVHVGWFALKNHEGQRKSNPIT